MRQLNGVSNRSRLLLVLLAIASSLFLMGCGLIEAFEPDKTGDELRDRTEEQQRISFEEQKKFKAEPDQVLAAGKVLSVRVRYGQSVGTMCTVRIDNPRNDWYDLVERSSEYALDSVDMEKYGDYDFGSTNFNGQITNEIKNPKFDDPKRAEGEYRVTVTTAGGFRGSTTIIWDGKRFQPNLLSFSTD